MSLKGNLKTTFIADILQLLCLEQKNGVLRVTSGKNEVKVFFEEGIIVYARESQKDDRLGYLLKSEGIISAEQLKKCLVVAKEKNQALGKILAKKGYISLERLKNFSRKQVEEIVCDLFCWEKGDFEYKDDSFHFEEEVVTRLHTIEFILEASRRVDEASVLKKQIPSDKLIFKISGKVQDKKKITLDPNEWRIISLIDGIRTVRQLISESGYEEFTVYKILYSLVSSGLIEKSKEGQYREDGDDVEHAVIKAEDKRKTILVVDDMQPMRDILRFSLKKEGYDVVVASNGETALKYAFDENSPDLIVLDIMMPKMDGYEVLRQLRESDAAKQIPVIFLTAKGQKKDVLKGMELGGNDYVVKPYKFKNLNKKIEKLLGQNRG
jgi:CheY-like chemotaxis protein